MVTEARYRRGWLLITVIPLAGLWIYELIALYSNFNGTCGLLDASWPCTREQYVEYSMMSGFVLPTLALWSVAWLAVVGLASLFLTRLRRKT